MNDVLDASWPENACLLTFDDGLVEHLDTVAPALERRHLRGVFCVPGQGVLERRLLDVHMVQLVLAAVPDHGMLAARTRELAGAEGVDAPSRMETPDHRFDPPETAFVKRALQDGLPEHRRRAVLDGLFRMHVGDDDRAFADDLYLTFEDCRELVRRGHDVIGHGYAHRRLGLLDERAQRSEIGRTLEFVASVGGTWALSYPHGSRNATTTGLLREHDCLLALTTESRRATREDPLLELPRIDTNDLQLELAGAG